MKYEILGIIPARGGSKGIPRKNIKELAGKPLIAYTIEAAKKSGVLSRMILSSEDKEIIEVGLQYGAEAPFVRPGNLAEDSIPTLPVLQHAVSWLKDNENYLPDCVMILQPTAPLRQAFHIQEAIKIMEEGVSDSVVSVSEVPGHHNPHWQFVVDKDHRLKVFTGEPMGKIIKRRQDLPKTYTRNGAIYILKTELLFRPEPTLFGEDARAYMMEDKYSVNIDSMEDWNRAEDLMNLVRQDRAELSS